MTRVEEPEKSESAGRVLLYLRTEQDASIIRDLLRGMAAEGVVCADLQDLFRRIVQEEADAIVLTESVLADEALPVLAEVMHRQPPWSDVPVLFVTGGGLESPLAVQAVRELPNVLILDRPVRMATLAGAVQMALRMRAKQRQIRDLLDERQRAQEALEDANERLRAQADALAAANEQLLTEREELHRQSDELQRLSLELRQLKEQAERTARAMGNLARLVEENPDPALRVLPDGSIQYANPASFPLVHLWNGADKRRVPPAVQEIVSAAYARTEVIRREIAFGERTYLITAASASPRAHSINIFVSDITARKRAEETLENTVAQRTAELRQRTRQLQKLAFEMSQAEERQREQLAHVLHDDLQQELAAAKFHLSIVRRRVQHDPSVQEVVATVDEMLKDAIGKSRSLSHDLSPAVLHQDDFVEILRWLASETQARHGLLAQVRATRPVHLQSDAIKAFLYRTAQELLFNTAKHAQVNEAKVRVRQCGGCICLAVSDHGRGFDPAKLHETAGFGLLSIRERIELLGGRMKIRSTPGKGSMFFVVVPNSRAVGVGPRAYPAFDGRGVKESGPGEPPLRVLLADDHEVVRQGLAALLNEEETVEVVGEATNGRAAVELAERLHPDVVVMDVSMPVMNGEEAARAIKKNVPHIRIVSLSVREEPEIRERMRAAGADRYVLKTAPYRELLAAIRGKDPAP